MANIILDELITPAENTINHNSTLNKIMNIRYIDVYGQ